MNRVIGLVIGVVISCSTFAAAQPGQPLGTEFAYQGELLKSGLPVPGPVDLRFRLYTHLSGGTLLATDLFQNVPLLQGRFTLPLDFGGGMFGPHARWLEIDVRNPASSGSWVTLEPRQRVYPVPAALYATEAEWAKDTPKLGRQVASFYTNAANLSGVLPNGTIAGSYSNSITLSNPSNVFHGSGTAITNLHASNLSTGTVPDARLGPNVARLNTVQTFTGSNTFATPPYFSNAAAPFSVASPTLISSLNADLLDGLDSSAFLQSIPVPIDLEGGIDGGAIIRAHNTHSGTGSIGIHGLSSADNALGSFTYGVLGENSSDSGAAVGGHATNMTGSNTWGGVFSNAGPSGGGVRGEAPFDYGETVGVEGISASLTGIGVKGVASNETGTGVLGVNAGLLGWAGRFEGRVLATGAPTGDLSFFQHSGSTGAAIAATGPTGVYAQSQTGEGVFGNLLGTSGSGVFGLAGADSGNTRGVFGQSNSTNGIGVFGLAAATTGSNDGVLGQTYSLAGTGVRGLAAASTGFGTGVNGESFSSSGTGVYGYVGSTSGFTWGVVGRSLSTQGTGVFGEATATSGNTHGVYGRSKSVVGSGVYGQSDGDNARGVVGSALGAGDSVGVFGESYGYQGAGVHGVGHGPEGVGVVGEAERIGLLGSGTAYGVYAKAHSGGGIAVFGEDLQANGTGTGLTGVGGSIGIYGYSPLKNGIVGLATADSAIAVYGFASDSDGFNYGVIGASDSPNGYGVFSDGILGGTIKAFRIDHPADPENRYLQHYATEGPEVVNFYRGTVSLDDWGNADVDLPHYFARINRDPSYSLTAVGTPMPMLHVAVEIDSDALASGAAAAPDQPAPICWFRISGGVPGGKVSWRVEALRNDLWMRTHGAPVEIVKQGHEVGRYQHPDLYGKPREAGLRYESIQDMERIVSETSAESKRRP